jgi:hypothetical protein
MKMKNITLSMDEELIRKGREVAAERGTTLNQMMRDLLSREVSREPGFKFMKMVAEANEKGYRSDGPYLTREEIYER